MGEREAQRLFEMTAKYGLPYFQHFINSEREPNRGRCLRRRLQRDLREWLKPRAAAYGAQTLSTSAPYASSFFAPMPLMPCRSSSVAGARSAIAASVASWKIT